MSLTGFTFTDTEQKSRWLAVQDGTAENVTELEAYALHMTNRENRAWSNLSVALGYLKNDDVKTVWDVADAVLKAVEERDRLREQLAQKASTAS